MKKNSTWDDVAEWWSDEAGESGVWHQEHDIDPVMLKAIGTVRGKKVLEIGCGNGYFARMLARVGAKVTAIDVSPKFIRIAREQERTERLGVRCYVRDAADLKGIRSGQFDLIVSNMALMDIPRFRQAIREASRVVKRGGRFVFSIVHPLYSDWQHESVTYNGRRYFARILKKYLSETADDRSHWKNGHATVHYHRPMQSYVHALRDARLLVKDMFEVCTSRKLQHSVSRNKKIMHKLTRWYLSADDRRQKFATRREIPLFLVVESVRR